MDVPVQGADRIGGVLVGVVRDDDRVDPGIEKLVKIPADLDAVAKLGLCLLDAPRILVEDRYDLGLIVDEDRTDVFQSAEGTEYAEPYFVFHVLLPFCMPLIFVRSFAPKISSVSGISGRHFDITP